MYRFLIFIAILFSITTIYANHDQFRPQIGDLYFQDLDCGVLCDGINQVTKGAGNTYVSHIGMVAEIKNGQPLIIEAAGNGVMLTPLNSFLNRSHDQSGAPRVMVGRLKPKYQNLIPASVGYAKKQLGKPYNATFYPNKGQSFYCSQLIYQAFLVSDNGQSIFHTNKMNFNDPVNHKTSKAWQAYFKTLHVAPPQNLIGTNPGMMSSESVVTIIYTYGKLRSAKQIP